MGKLPPEDGRELLSLYGCISIEQEENTVLKKAFTKTGRSCRVTFAVPPQVKAKKVALCGEFNDWDPKTHLLKRRKDGSFSLTVSLPTGRPYRFRYFVDGERWENDFAADDYMPNPFGSDDSVLKL